MRRLTYAAVTPARNEEENLGRLGEAMRNQTLRPLSWTIVENGSTDETLAVAREIAEEIDFVRIVVREQAESTSRGAPIVRALEQAVDELPVKPDIIVNVDADVSFDEHFFETLIGRFEEDARLGIASGSCYELDNNDRWTQRHVTGNTVWGATRAYRSSASSGSGRSRGGWAGTGSTS